MTFVVSAPQLYTSDGSSNFSYVGNKKIDELVKKLATSPTMTSRPRP
mgnify:FL=1